MRSAIGAVMWGLVAISAPTAASAAEIVNFDGNYGSFGAIVSGDFAHEWTFEVPEAGIIGGSVTAVKLTSLPGVTFSSVQLNGIDLDAQTDGDLQFFELGDTFTDLMVNTISITGSGYGAYAGSVAFTLFDDGGNPQPAVPEPASWAMMITGFGLVGGAMRRRSKHTHVAFAI